MKKGNDKEASGFSFCMFWESWWQIRPESAKTLFWNGFGKGNNCKGDWEELEQNLWNHNQDKHDSEVATF